jgi:hypothetical protein
MSNAKKGAGTESKSVAHLPYEAGASNVDLDFNYWLRQECAFPRELAEMLHSLVLGKKPVCLGTRNSYEDSSDITLVTIHGISATQLEQVHNHEFFRNCSYFPLLSVAPFQKIDDIKRVNYVNTLFSPSIDKVRNINTELLWTSQYTSYCNDISQQMVMKLFQRQQLTFKVNSYIALIKIVFKSVHVHIV